MSDVGDFVDWCDRVDGELTVRNIPDPEHPEYDQEVTCETDIGTVTVSGVPDISEQIDSDNPLLDDTHDWADMTGRIDVEYDLETESGHTIVGSDSGVQIKPHDRHPGWITFGQTLAGYDRTNVELRMKEQD